MTRQHYKPSEVGKILNFIVEHEHELRDLPRGRDIEELEGLARELGRSQKSIRAMLTRRMQFGFRGVPARAEIALRRLYDVPLRAATSTNECQRRRLERLQNRRERGQRRRFDDPMTHDAADNEDQQDGGRAEENDGDINQTIRNRSASQDQESDEERIEEIRAQDDPNILEEVDGGRENIEDEPPPQRRLLSRSQRLERSIAHLANVGLERENAIQDRQNVRLPDEARRSQSGVDHGVRQPPMQDGRRRSKSATNVFNGPVTMHIQKLVNK